MKAIEISGVMLSNGVFLPYNGLDKFIQLVNDNDCICKGKLIDFDENGIMLGGIPIITERSEEITDCEMDFDFDKIKDVKLISEKEYQNGKGAIYDTARECWIS